MLKGPLIAMEGFIVASWVIRAIWRETQGFVLEFKPAYSSGIYILGAFSLKRVTYEIKETIH